MPTVLHPEFAEFENSTPSVAGVEAAEAVWALEQAQQRCEAQQWEQAIALSQTGLQWFETGVALGYRLSGWALQEQGNYAEAEQFYRKALMIQPENAETHARLGSLYATQESWQMAIDAYQQAIDLDPLFAGAHLKLAESLRQLGNATESALHYYHGLQLQPNLVPALTHAQLGDQLAAQDQLEAAIKSYQLALTLDPQQTATWINLAETLVRQAQPQMAIACYQQALVEQPKQAALYSRLGNLLTQQGQPEAAIPLHQQAALLRGWSLAAERDYHFTSDWFTHNISNWQEYFRPYAHQAEIQVLEIGSYEGMSACWLLDQVLTHETAQLTTIDPYYAVYFEDNIKKTDAFAKLNQFIGNSHEILPTLPAHIYDIIYIDGCHLASHVHRDAELSWSLLKQGGLMIFDDYIWSEPTLPEADPRFGIDAFLDSIPAQFQLVQQAYQLVIRKSIHS